MASAGSVFVDLLLRDGQFVRGMSNAQSASSRTFNSISKDSSKAGQSLTGIINPVQSLSTAFRALAGVAAASLSVREIVQYSDAWKQLESRLLIVEGTMSGVASAQNSLFEIAQRTRQPLESITNLYTRLNQAVPEAQRAQYDLLGVAESVSIALAITGEGSAQAASAILQFSQAVSSDFKASSQEINSLLDSAPRLAIALQKSFGDGSKSLKQLAADGDLSRDAVLKALVDMTGQGGALREEFEKVSVTVGQAFTQLDNAFLRYIGRSDSITLGTSSVASAITGLANNFDALAKGVIILSSALSARMVASLVASGSAFVSNSLAQRAAYIASVDLARANLAGAVAAYNMARAQYAAGASANVLAVAAANATRAQLALNVTLAASVGVAGRLLALLGGPIGIALTGTAVAIAYLATEESYLDVRTKELTASKERLIEINGGLTGASEEVTKQLKAEREEILNNTKEQLANATARLTQLRATLAQQKQGAGAGLFGSVGVSGTQGYVEAQEQVVKETLAAIEELNALINSPVSSSSSSVSEENNKSAKSIQDMIAALTQQRDTLGKSEEEIIRYRIAQGDLAEALKKTGSSASIFAGQLIELTADLEQGKAVQSIQDMIDALKEQNAIYGKSASEALRYKIEQGSLSESFILAGESANALKEELIALTEENTRITEQWGFDIEALSKRAAENIQDSFADFLFDPFEKGLDGMLLGFVNTLRKMAAEAAAAEILKGIGSGSGGLGGLFSSISGLFSKGTQVYAGQPVGPFQDFVGPFADGGNIPAGKWGIVGEEGPEVAFGGQAGKTIMNASQIGGLSSGGNTYNIDARGADQSAIARLEASLFALAGPGKIEQRVINGQKRGSL